LSSQVLPDSLGMSAKENQTNTELWKTSQAPTSFHRPSLSGSPWRNFWAGGSRLPYVSGKTGWPSTRSHSRTPPPALQTHSRTPDISVLGGSSCRRKVSRKIENVRGRRTECSSSAKSRCRSRMRKNQTTSWYRNYFNFDECLLSA